MKRNANNKIVHCDGLTGPNASDGNDVEDFYHTGDTGSMTASSSGTEATFTWKDQTWAEQEYEVKFFWWNQTEEEWELFTRRSRTRDVGVHVPTSSCSSSAGCGRPNALRNHRQGRLRYTCRLVHHVWMAIFREVPRPRYVAMFANSVCELISPTAAQKSLGLNPHLTAGSTGKRGQQLVALAGGSNGTASAFCKVRPRTLRSGLRDRGGSWKRSASRSPTLPGSSDQMTAS